MDVFQDDSPNIVDCDVLEAAKENVQPLAAGRRVTALSAILSTPHAHREAKLYATRNRLRINVELALDDEDGDPLEAYCRLVYWTLENYPQGHSAESGLLELLEEATRVLKDDGNGRWRGELKYLKLWLLYASFVEKQTVIYRFLIANEIGTDFAILYEEYAAVLERDGRRKEADAAYLLGIARKAEPLEHLQNRHSDFQKRMMCNSAVPTASNPPERSVPIRPALATSAIARGTTPSVPLPARAHPPASNAPMRIFVDPTGSEAEAAEIAASNAWDDLGTRKSRIKENVPEVKKMVGTTIKQAGKSKRIASGSSAGSSSRLPSTTSKIVPYRDPGPEEASPAAASSSSKKKKDASVPENTSLGSPMLDGRAADVLATPRFTPFRDEVLEVPSASAVTAPESALKVKKASVRAPVPTTEAEALRKDPLKNYGPDADLAVYADE